MGYYNVLFIGFKADVDLDVDVDVEIIEPWFNDFSIWSNSLIGKTYYSVLLVYFPYDVDEYPRSIQHESWWTISFK